jgi:hypothetical protein
VDVQEINAMLFLLRCRLDDINDPDEILDTEISKIQKALRGLIGGLPDNRSLQEKLDDLETLSKIRTKILERPLTNENQKDLVELEKWWVHRAEDMFLFLADKKMVEEFNNWRASRDK